MKRWFAGLVLLTLFATGCEAYMRSPADKAWQNAMRLAQVPENEWSKWEKPITTVVKTPRYIPIDEHTGLRLCGVTEPFLEGDTPQTLHIVVYVRAFVRPTGERQLLIDVLTHEFLHVIWLRRAIADVDNNDWMVQHPDSEEYVRGLIPNSCPSF